MLCNMLTCVYYAFASWIGRQEEHVTYKIPILEIRRVLLGKP